MIKISTSRHMNMASHTITVGRLRINITNRPQLFEEKKLRKVFGWWSKVNWRKDVKPNPAANGVHYG